MCLLFNRLVIMVILSTGVFLGAYFIKPSLGTILIAALAGYLLSTDLGGLGSQLLTAIRTRNKVAASSMDVREPVRKKRGYRFLWSWGIFEVLYHLLMLAIVGVMAGELTTKFS